jgi:hypothetical protein
MNKNKTKLVLIGSIILVIIFLASITSVKAYSYVYGTDYYPVVYNYYDNDKYQYAPVIAGPFPRGYLWNSEWGNGEDITYRHDDFNNYDSFIGYKDLDVINPQTGVVEIYRNENSRELDTSYIPEDMKAHALHVYGYIPGPAGSCPLMYIKHYNHEHPWEMDTYSYGYNYGYQYYTPWLAYKTVPQTTRSCQSTSACQYTHNCC